MKDNYPRRRSGNNMLTVLGFGFAVIMMVGYLKNSGYDLVRSDGLDQANVAAARIYDEEREPAEVTNLTLETDRTGDYDGRRYDNAEAYQERQTSKRSSGTSKRMPRGEEWVEEFASVAVSQAVSRGVPAGLSLAVGLQHLEHGAVIISWSDFVEKVVDPLAKVKQRAPSAVRGEYFKYSANSDLWAEGLGQLGKYSEREIRGIIRQYDLGSFDRRVREAVISGSSVDEVTLEKAAYVAEEVTTHARETRRDRPVKEKVAVGGSIVDQVREMEEGAYYDEFVGREVAREIARRKLKSGKYLGEEDMDQLIEETNRETGEVVKNKLTFLGRGINREHPEAEALLDITKKENAAAREELYQRKLRENKLDSRSRRNHKD